ncbi:MAG: hypothetical protein ACRD0B_04495, partial [Acidimicrobiales bacterium]
MTATVVAESRPLSEEDVSDRLEAIAETYGDDRPGPVVVCDGFGVRVRVERGALEVSDGVGQDRRLRSFDRATHQLARLVVLNAAGTLSIDSLRWCQGAGVAVVVIDPHGELLLTSAGVS